MMMVGNAVISIFLAVVMMLTPLSAGAQVDLMFEDMNNYTQESVTTVTFDNPKEFVALLKECDPDGAEEMEYFTNYEKLFETAASSETKFVVKADTSADLMKAQVSMVMDDFNSIELNRNLKVDVASKIGLWADYDFTDEKNLSYKLIIALPFLDKYVEMDIFEMFDMLPEGEEKELVISTMLEAIKQGNSEETKAFTKSLFEKYADVKISLTGATVKIDNKGLANILKEIFEYSMTLLKPYLSEEEIASMEEEIAIFDFEAIQILGKDGITMEYTVNGDTTKIMTNADISIDISGIYTALTGEVWDFESSGKLDFTVKSENVISEVGNTKVEFPTLTKENSISLAEMIEEEMNSYEDYEEYTPSYPYFYVWGQTDKLPVIDGEIFVPLRDTLESAYEESVTIGFENGVITATSEFFPEFKTIKLINGSDKVYFDDVEKTTSKVFISDGTTYVSKEFFTEYFGWDFSSASYDLIENIYDYTFYTE